MEIATRDLLEPNRYGLEEKVGKALGLDTGSLASLWKDKVAYEMNKAVLHSFAQVGATIVDQHTVSEQFQTHYLEEMKVRGGCPSDWVWLTPSQSGSLTPLYHQEMLHYNLSPSLDRQPLPWETYRSDFPCFYFPQSCLISFLGFLMRARKSSTNSSLLLWRSNL